MTTPATGPEKPCVQIPVRVDERDCPIEHWADPARGSIGFKTLVSASSAPTDTLVCGIAVMEKGDNFAQHSHPQPEVYFGLEGEARVLIDGVPHLLAPGVALFIPGGAWHGVALADQPVRWFYTFAADAFADITYRFA